VDAVISTAAVPTASLHSRFERLVRKPMFIQRR